MDLEKLALHAAFEALSPSFRLPFENIFVNGAWAGTVAARSEPLFGIPGFIIVEEVLAAPWRRQGLGPILQRCLAEKIIQQYGENNLLHGTIAGINLPSLRTALRSGREIVTTLVKF